MSQTEKEMKAEIEEMYREVPKCWTDEYKRPIKSFSDCDPADDPTHEAFSIKPHGIEVQSYQVGGTHYAKHKIQPWDVIDEYGLNFYEGNALKYLLRRKGNRLEDLQKAKHYIEKLIDGETKDNTR